MRTSYGYSYSCLIKESVFLTTEITSQSFCVSVLGIFIDSGCECFRSDCGKEGREAENRVVAIADGVKSNTMGGIWFENFQIMLLSQSLIVSSPQ